MLPEGASLLICPCMGAIMSFTGMSLPPGNLTGFRKRGDIMISRIRSGRMSIHRRILFMVSAAGLFAFLVMWGVSLLDMYRVQTNAMERGEHLGADFEVYVEELIVSQTRTQLMRVADAKAQQINREIMAIRDDTDYLAHRVEYILANPELFEPRTLPDPRNTKMSPGEAYMLYSPYALGDTADAAVFREMGIAANAAGGIETMCEFYRGDHISIYMGSKHGYLIRADIFSSDDAYAKIHSEEFHNKYDPRERPWYKLAEQYKRPLFTDVYIDTDGNFALTCVVPYFDVNGFAGACATDVNLDLLYQHVSRQSVGETDINFAIEKNGKILFSSEKEGIFSFGNGTNSLINSSEPDIAAEAVNMIEGGKNVVLVNVDGEDYYIAYAPIESVGWSFATMLKRSEAIAMAVEARKSISAQAESFSDNMKKNFLGNLFKLALLLLLLAAGIFAVSKRAAEQFASPILTLTDGVREIARGNLDKKLEVKSGDEIEELSESMNRMTADIKAYIQGVARATAEKKRVATEMNLARSIQEGMLPDIYPKFSCNEHYSIAATMEAAKEVGGDFYDCYALDENHLVVTVADVSGKGIPASLFMAVSKTLLKNCAMAAFINSTGEVDWGQVMARVNDNLCENNDEDMFVTAIFGVLNILTGEFVYVNAGHNSLLIGRVKTDGVDWQFINNKNENLMLGTFEESVYMVRRLVLKPGDMLYMYTDGVTEAMDPDGNLYTEGRLQEILNSDGGADVTVVDILKKIREDIDKHAEGAEQSDDITMLGLRFLG